MPPFWYLLLSASAQGADLHTDLDHICKALDTCADCAAATGPTQREHLSKHLLPRIAHHDAIALVADLPTSPAADLHARLLTMVETTHPDSCALAAVLQPPATPEQSAAVKQALARYSPILKSCYHTAVKQGSHLQGRMVLELTGLGDGHVRGRIVDRVGIDNPAFVRCIVEDTATWVVPIQKGFTFSFPLSFE